MAIPTLIATAGASDANSYATVAEANSYFDTQLYKDNWEGSYSDQQTVALIFATRVIDEQMDWYGYKVTSEQALRWPRDGILDQDGYDVSHLIIPQFLINAVAEFAGYLIGENRTAENDTKGFSKMKGDVLELTIDKNDRVGILPDSVLQMISPYGISRSTKQQPKVYRT
jgi:hypothetical protein